MARKLYQSIDPVTWTGVYEEDGYIYCAEEMPGKHVQTIIDSVQSSEAARSIHGTVIGARVPITLWTRFKKEWEKTAKPWGVPWHKFYKSKINSTEYSKLRFMRL